MRGRAAPFKEHEVEVARAFRLDVQEVAFGKLSELEHARDLMLAALGHDLRSPLGAISMAATLLNQGSSSPVDLGQRIARSSHRMQRLIEQMLDLSRIQAGLGLGVQRQPGDLAAVMRSAVDEARLGFPGTLLEVESPERVPASIDPDRMGHVISNLLSNACHHGKVGAAVQVSLQVQGEFAVLAVKNAGGPIPAHTRGQIFQPFKLESLQERRNRSGLGLHIANEIVKSHAGRIEIADQGGYVTVRVLFPSS